MFLVAFSLTAVKCSYAPRDVSVQDNSNRNRRYLRFLVHTWTKAVDGTIAKPGPNGNQQPGAPSGSHM